MKSFTDRWIVCNRAILRRWGAAILACAASCTAACESLARADGQPLDRTSSAERSQASPPMSSETAPDGTQPSQDPNPTDNPAKDDGQSDEPPTEGLVPKSPAALWTAATNAVGRLDWQLAPPTLGGRVVWGDVLFFRGWRIQQHATSGKHRLLDPKDRKFASGSFEQCQTALDQVRQKRQLEPMTGKALVMVHGIIRSSKSFSKATRLFTDAGYTVVPFDYPSTLVEIPECAEYLHRVLSSLEGIDQIDLLVHSMGGLVVRSYLQKHTDPRITRMVMLGVPNLGAHMADRVRELSLYRAIFGPAGQQLITDAEGLIAKLPTPSFEFAILAGCRGTPNGYNPLIPGDDDGTVSVSSTRLPGASDFREVRCLHSFMMYDDTTMKSALSFFETGQLDPDRPPQPIQRPVDSTSTKESPSQDS